MYIGIVYVYMYIGIPSGQKASILIRRRLPSKVQSAQVRAFDDRAQC